MTTYMCFSALRMRKSNESKTGMELYDEIISENSSIMNGISTQKTKVIDVFNQI